jgi:hypothetical protein
VLSRFQYVNSSSTTCNQAGAGVLPNVCKPGMSSKQPDVGRRSAGALLVILDLDAPKRLAC